MSHEHPHLIFVLAGQSNMAGRGALEQALPASPQVLMLSGEDGQVPSSDIENDNLILKRNW